MTKIKPAHSGKITENKGGGVSKGVQGAAKNKSRSSAMIGTWNLPELHTGDYVRLKDKTSMWAQKATILNEVQPRSYNIQIEDGAVLRQNQCDIMGQAKADQRTDDAAEQPQHSENPSSEVPAPVQEQPLRRSLRNVKPPGRLTEQI